ncbi:MAG: hypothetical protein AAGJ46_15030 [Planctomycetota bacterium]
MTLSQELIRRIDQHPASLRAISAGAQIPYSSLRNFRLGRTELKVKAIDRLISYLDLEVAFVNTGGEAAESSNAGHEFSNWLIELMGLVDNRQSLEIALDFIYRGLASFVPFQRVGFADIDHETDTVTARWFRSTRPARLSAGYSARLSSSSLRFVVESRRPRLLNLQEFLRRHPDSCGTRLIVEEGFAASLAYPVVADDVVRYLLFFNSVDPLAFDEASISRCAAVTVQLGRLTSTEAIAPGQGTPA